MNCLKCGRDVEQGQVFCPECLEEMKKHPVKPDTPIRLPRRPDPTLRRAARRKAVSEEEQIRALKKRLRIMTLLFGAVLALLIAIAVPMAIHLGQEHIAFLPGQNYSSAADAAPAGN